MWLFGELDTLGDSKAQQQNDENARTITALLEQLADLQPNAKPEGLGQAPPLSSVTEA